MDFPSKYRPSDFSQLRGQSSCATALARYKDQFPQAVLFHGPPGTGKTSAARIMAVRLGAELFEINAANTTQVDSWRTILEAVGNRTLSGKPKIYIIDECHALSQSSWKLLHKPIEEPPAHVYWVLCTTEPEKVPAAIKTRCTRFEMRPVSAQNLEALVSDVAEREGLWSDLDTEAKAKAVWEVVRGAERSPRQALTSLQATAHATTLEEVQNVLRRNLGAPKIRDFCRALARPGLTWEGAIEMLRGFDKATDPEAFRRTIVGYMTAVVLSPNTSADRMPRLLAVLQVFGEPYSDTRTIAPVLVSLGRLYHGRK